MKVQNILIHHIPAMIWGEPSDKVYIHVHGKQSCKEYAADFAAIAEQKGYQTLSFDLPEHGERTDDYYRCDIWNGIQDLTVIGDYAFSKWSEVSLFACSLGAYFSLNAYANRTFRNCLFQSPVLDMEYLIRQMFVWFQVTEERLFAEQEIATPVDLLRWDYFQYVVAHPVEQWNCPTAILYGGKDNLQSMDILREFAKTYGCQLTISPSSDHPFMEHEDIEIVSAWLQAQI